ncbi:restriction endonuclease subunit S (plasmid) [Acinetobacter baumannii]|uniref:Restriction endonuclease subunit S n=1 Tax=Acinetobacter nosocomialis TaxID=106654 RepID=A0AB37D1Z7_ACINO|nr:MULTISPECIES: restriction endonuclease subunit S [Acinetobacter calcoaceticus/baumannii complex]MCJ9254618.1 restriction endonuclease subunit S [Acinetobacter baumannii]MCJ9258704.1 restriction endonuclease subunit S [Acinetobacter baumannii]MDA4917521.1 restriction endonuclease subunit S [Acinetobacter baumannii]MDA4920357.1 restriction endonuclease subunit S [Acinetobacter baumannii]MDA4986012.1 restriction endonuclease subunit S [Acinetobacter baumannii]
MQFKQYPSYKPSGVEWLGDVPEHWDSCNLKFISKIYAGGTPDRNRLDYWVKGEIPWINSGAVNQVIIKEPSEYITELGLKNSSAKYIPVNSLVMALAGQGKTKGMVAYTSIETTCNQSMAAIVPKNYHYKFLYYWLDSNYQNIRNLTGGDNRDGLNLAVLSNIPCPKISIVEQTQIASFLDYETFRIDNLIAKQEKLIELLEEQRKSIISHAVTKGLNPNAPMKDSGVEWLGDVPEHWNLKKFCYLFDENKKKNIGLQETNVLSLSYGNIKEKNIDDNKGLLPESFETYQIIKPNDIVFRFTDLQNDKRSLRSAISKYHGIITSAYIAVKTKQNADFYNYLFRAYDLQKVFYSMGEGMRQSLKMDELNKMPVVLPSEDEQKRIVSFLDSETSRIDNLIAKQEKLIEKLKEYRSSIISHAVTGKIDIRELVA